MPSIKSLYFIYYNRLITIILLLSKVILSYSRYAENKLIYTTIVALSSYRPSFYTKYTKLNIRLFYNV